AAQASERCGGRSEHGEFPTCHRRLQPAHDLARELHRILERATADDSIDERDKWWVPHSPAEHQFALEERGEVLLAGELDAVVLRVQRLHDRLACPRAPARSPSYLREQLKRPLRGAEIGQTKTHIGGNHTNECDSWKIVSFRDHLCA